MKRFVSYMTTGLLAGALALPTLAVAQTPGANGAASGPVIINSAGAPVSDLPMSQYRAFSEFHQAHPDIVRKLARNPRLVNNESFQQRHPALREFLLQHPDFAEDFSENPGDYVLPARTRVKRHHAERHAAAGANQSDSDATNTGAVSANANNGKMNGGAAASGASDGGNATAPSTSAGANATSNSAETAPKGVPAATGEPGRGNSGAADGSSSGNNM